MMPKLADVCRAWVLGGIDDAQRMLTRP
jgi:hypothetical protein